LYEKRTSCEWIGVPRENAICQENFFQAARLDNSYDTSVHGEVESGVNVSGVEEHKELNVAKLRDGKSSFLLTDYFRGICRFGGLSSGLNGWVAAGKSKSDSPE